MASSLVEQRRKWKQAIDQASKLSEEMMTIVAGMRQLEQQKQGFHHRLREITSQLQAAAEAKFQLNKTSCPSRAEFELSNKINELYHSMDRTPHRRVEIEDQLKPLYAKRDAAAESRLDPEQCEGGKKFWAPPDEVTTNE